MDAEDLYVGKLVVSIGQVYLTDIQAPVDWRIISFDKTTACLARMGDRPGPAIDWLPIEWLYHTSSDAKAVIQAAKKPDDAKIEPTPAATICCDECENRFESNPEDWQRLVDSSMDLIGSVPKCPEEGCTGLLYHGVKPSVQVKETNGCGGSGQKLKET